jgi:polysaccharide biosynthesis protein PslJ
MSAVAGAHPIEIAEPRPLARGTLLIGIVATFPALWLLGVFRLVWPVVAFFFLLALIREGNVSFPRGFGIWLLLVAWAPLSALHLHGSGFLLLHQLSALGAATVVFLYIFNSSHRTLPDTAIIDALTLFWATLVVTGVIAMIFPSVSFHSPFERLLPHSLVAHEFVHDLVHVRFAQVQSFLGYPVGRPSPFYTFTNAWGGGVALLTPIVFAALAQTQSFLKRRILWGLLALSVIPIIVSLNRGVWLALTLAMAYAALRFALAQRLHALAALIAAGSVLLTLFFLTPLGTYVSDRLASPHSNESRAAVYREAADRAKESPLIGYGGPIPAEQSTGPPVGTHSELFFLTISYGIPAAVLFVGWIGLTVIRSGRDASGPRFWAHVAMLVALMTAPYYLLEMHLSLVMIIAAFLWRGIVRPSTPAPTPEPTPRSATG